MDTDGEASEGTHGAPSAYSRVHPVRPGLIDPLRKPLPNASHGLSLASVRDLLSLHLFPASFNSWHATHSDTDGFARSRSSGISSPQFAHWS